ncbi:MAG: hypothetical protein ACXWLH_03115 [Candidatus Saccharimonadales bacterium]
MMPLVVIGILIGLPLILSFVLRVNAGILFLALCAGSVVSQFVSSDAVQLVNSFFPRSGDMTASVTQLVFLLLPAALTILFMRRSITGAKSMVNLLPAAASGLLTALLAVPLLPAGTRYGITGSQAWSVLQQFQSLIIGAGAFVSLLVLWGTKPKHDKKKKHK